MLLASEAFGGGRGFVGRSGRGAACGLFVEQLVVGVFELTLLTEAGGPVEFDLDDAPEEREADERD